MTKIEDIPFAEPKGKVRDINHLKNVIRFILKTLPKENTKYKTEIIKLCFIIDYEYSKQFKEENPTTVKYVRYNYGPYSDHFVNAFQQLIEEGKIVEVGLQFGVGYSTLSEEEPDIEDKIKLFIKEILKKYGNSSLKQMKEYIYDLPEFKETEFGHEIVLIK
jgi:uncharacterized protein YwgA